MEILALIALGVLLGTLLDAVKVLALLAGVGILALALLPKDA